MTEWRKVRNKPVEVEVWGPWDGTGRMKRTFIDSHAGAPARYKIDVLEAAAATNKGDYIIRGVKGELYPCKPDVFAETYEDVQLPLRTGGRPFEDRRGRQR